MDSDDVNSNNNINGNNNYKFNNLKYTRNLGAFSLNKTQ